MSHSSFALLALTLTRTRRTTEISTLGTDAGSDHVVEVAHPVATTAAIPHARLQHTAPNGWRVSGSRRAEGDERVRCTRMLGGPVLNLITAQKGQARRGGFP